MCYFFIFFSICACDSYPPIRTLCPLASTRLLPGSGSPFPVSPSHPLTRRVCPSVCLLSRVGTYILCRVRPLCKTVACACTAPSRLLFDTYIYNNSVQISVCARPRAWSVHKKAVTAAALFLQSLAQCSLRGGDQAYGSCLGTWRRVFGDCSTEGTGVANGVKETLSSPACFPP